MSVSLLLGAFLSAAPVHARTDVRLVLPRQTLSLGAAPEIHYEAGLTVTPHGLGGDGVYATTPDGDLQQTESSLQHGQSIYRTGAVGAVTGLVITGIGAGAAMVGIIPALLGSDELLLIGTGTVIGGVIILGVSVPVMMAGGNIARLALEEAGISFSPTPRRVMLTGVGLLVGGAVAGSGSLMAAGILCVIGGSAAQMINVRRAFRTYEAEHAPAVTWRLLPLVTPEARGAALAVRF